MKFNYKIQETPYDKKNEIVARGTDDETDERTRSRWEVKRTKSKADDKEGKRQTLVSTFFPISLETYTAIRQVAPGLRIMQLTRSCTWVAPHATFWFLTYFYASYHRNRLLMLSQGRSHTRSLANSFIFTGGDRTESGGDYGIQASATKPHRPTLAWPVRARWQFKLTPRTAKTIDGGNT